MAEEKPRGEEVNPRKGEDNYEFQFGNMKVLMDTVIAHSQEVFANMKLLMDNAIAHSQALNGISQQNLQESVDLQKRINDQYIAREQQVREHHDSTFGQRLEHENEIETTRQENMRFTLKYLYGEVADALAEAIVEKFKQAGLVVPEEK